MTARGAFDEVTGQDAVVEQLAAAAESPVHAYLFLGRRGTGKRTAAFGFAGAVLARGRGDAERHVALAVAGRHPDLVVIEPEGRMLRMNEAEQLIVEGSRSPVEADHKVIVCDRFHTAEPAVAASLLKTIEEPPATAIFVLLAEEVPPEQVTVASRCVTVEFAPLDGAAVAGWLTDRGVAPDEASVIAEAAAGDLDRAALLAEDPAFGNRRTAWERVPTRLDGSGAVVAELVDGLRAMIDDAQLPLDARHEVELEELAATEEQLGTRGSGRRELEAKHRREKRLLRDDELRFGFGLLARQFRDALVAGTSDQATYAAVARLRDAAEALERNPNEALLLQALFLSLPARSAPG